MKRSHNSHSLNYLVGCYAIKLYSFPKNITNKNNATEKENPAKKMIKAEISSFSSSKSSC
jgi:hypothetical protein